MSTTWKKGKGHQDPALIVGEIGVVNGDINLRIAKTPHFVNIMTSSAMLQHWNVSKCAIIVGEVDMLYNLVTN